MIDFDCEHCGKTLRVKDEAAGKRGRCKHCGRAVTVPAGAPAAVEAEGTEADASEEDGRPEENGTSYSLAMDDESSEEGGDDDWLNDVDASELNDGPPLPPTPPRAPSTTPPGGDAAEPAAAPEPRLRGVPLYRGLQVTAWIAMFVGTLMFALGLLWLAFFVFAAFLAESAAAASMGLGVGILSSVGPILGGLVIRAVGDALMALRDIAINSWLADGGMIGRRRQRL